MAVHASEPMVSPNGRSAPVSSGGQFRPHGLVLADKQTGMARHRPLLPHSSGNSPRSFVRNGDPARARLTAHDISRNLILIWKVLRTKLKELTPPPLHLLACDSAS